MTDVQAANVTPIRTLDDGAALAWLRSQPGGRTDLSTAALASRWGWQKYTVVRRLQRWQKDGLIERRGRFIETAPEVAPETVGVAPKQMHRIEITGEPVAPADRSVAVRDAAKAAGEAATVAAVAPRSTYLARLVDAPEDVDSEDFFLSWPGAGEASFLPDKPRRSVNVLAYLVAVGLAAVAALFSIRGMITLFPGAPMSVVAMAGMMEAAKLVACAWLASNWNRVPYIWRGALMLLIAGLMLINAAGLFSQLTAAHVGQRALSAAAATMEGTDVDARIEVASAKLADLDRRLGAIDAIVTGAAQRGRARTATSIMEEQNRTRTGLVAERKPAVEELADLKVQRGDVQARASIAESEAMPLRYAAKLLGMGGDDERAIRLLIALMVLCCDPLAIALTAAASARRSGSV